MKKVLTAVTLVAIVALIGCQDTKKVTELQGQLDQANQKLTEMEGQVAKLTAERDSLAGVIKEMEAKKPAAPAKAPAKQPGGTQPAPTGKPPRTGR